MEHAIAKHAAERVEEVEGQRMKNWLKTTATLLQWKNRNDFLVSTGFFLLLFLLPLESGCCAIQVQVLNIRNILAQIAYLKWLNNERNRY